MGAAVDKDLFIELGEKNEKKKTLKSMAEIFYFRAKLFAVKRERWPGLSTNKGNLLSPWI